VTDRPEDPRADQDTADDAEVDVDVDLDVGPATGEIELELELQVADPEGEDDDLDDADPLEDDNLDPDVVGEVDETVGDGRVAYDCASWAAESRGLLASLLETNGVRHAWQGTTVTVLVEDQRRVDVLVDEVLVSARPVLEDGRPRVVYEVGSWPAALQTSIADSLTVADIPYEWDERGDLVVYAEHEEEVEAILEDLPDPDDVADGDELSADDGIAVHELLDGLFIAAGKLAKRPDDGASVLKVDEVARDLERMPPPFGFETAQWRSLVERAVRLRDALAAGPSSEDALDDEELVALAGEVRDLVRRYV
jgi:hypothetical protein